MFRSVVIVAASVTLIAGGLLYLAEGSVTPCGILKKRLLHRVEHESPGSADPFDKGVQVMATAVKNKVDALTPMECLTNLRRLLADERNNE